MSAFRIVCAMLWFAVVVIGCSSSDATDDTADTDTLSPTLPPSGDTVGTATGQQPESDAPSVDDTATGGPAATDQVGTDTLGDSAQDTSPSTDDSADTHTAVDTETPATTATDVATESEAATDTPADSDVPTDVATDSGTPTDSDVPTDIATDSGTPTDSETSVDECDFTAECQAKYPGATDCANSWSSTSVCMCGSVPCSQSSDTGADTETDSGIPTDVDTGTQPDTDVTGCPVIPSVLPPPPAGKKWRKVDAMSDEFNGTTLDPAKWAKSDPQWEGRKPARFEESAISVGDCNLRITASKKTNPWGGWTHNGGLVRSYAAHTYGYYEARIKANHTCLSSTFWLFNQRLDYTGCDRRTTELDILETVGWNAADQNWIDTFMRQMNSNTHSRGTTCAETPVGQNGNRANIGGYAYEDYHIYAAWWVSPTEVRFYLDNQYVYTITPPAPFNLKMYLRMVVESYDWNKPEDGDDGMTGSWEERTTFYDFVRTWELVDAN